MLKALVTKVRSYIANFRRDPVERYLAEAIDIYDLERRMEMIDRGLFSQREKFRYHLQQ